MNTAVQPTEPPDYCALYLDCCRALRALESALLAMPHCPLKVEQPKHLNPIANANADFKRIAGVLGVTTELLRGHWRPEHLTLLRFIAYTLLYERGFNLQTVAVVSNRHHTGVLHGIRAMTNRCDTDIVYRDYVSHVRARMNEIAPS